MLVTALCAHARDHGITSIFLLTETAQAFFLHLDFSRVERSEVPDAVKASVEFRGACPASAVAMRRDIERAEAEGTHRDQSPGNQSFDPYVPRPMVALKRLESDGWRLKRYAVCHESQSFDESRFSGGVSLALSTLPQPARTRERVGAGFLILHQGNGIDYTVLGWWDRQNELPLRVFVCDRPGTNRWRPARESESVCVWDLQILWAEREAYVRTVLARPHAGAADEYLAANALS